MKERQSTKLNEDDKFISTMASVVSSSALSVARLGARNVVLSMLADAIIPILSSAQGLEAAAKFQRAIEEIMAIMDDQRLPAEYHSTLLAETNASLARLHNLFDA